jgi:hypothetical protein
MATTDGGGSAAALSLLKAEWPSGAWTWDGRMSMVTATVSGEQVAAGRSLAARALPLCFDDKTLAGAAPQLVSIVERYGGLRGGQLVFSNGEVFGLWWPWGGGGTVSLRVGLLGDASKLRALFGL